MRTAIIILFLLKFFLPVQGQTLGGNSVYNFLKLSNSPQVTALGGINISQLTDDIGVAFNNPALLRPEMHSQLNMVFNNFYAGIDNYHWQTGFYHEKASTTFAIGLNFFSYGRITETDMSGNEMGTIRPVDYVLQVSAARQYLERWHYGVTLKFIHSAYGIYRSSGIALDAGVSYTDTSHMIQASLVLKNMGTQLTTYTGSGAAALPFDIQLGISKKLLHAPLQFSVTAHQLHHFDIRYDDETFNNENGYSDNTSGKKYIFDKLFSHIVAAAQLFIGEKVEISTGYNHLRRKELNIGNSGNGLNGFSLGAGLLFPKIQIRYARSYYQNNTSYNQFGLNLKLNDYFGPGKLGKSTGW